MTPTRRSPGLWGTLQLVAGPGSGLRGGGGTPLESLPSALLGPERGHGAPEVAERAGVGWAPFPAHCAQIGWTWAALMHAPRGHPERRIAGALAEGWLGTGQLEGPAVPHAGAWVLGRIVPHAPPLPVQTQHLGWNQAHGDHLDATLGLGLCRMFWHLAEASVGGEVVGDGVLPALLVLPEKGDVAWT